MSKLNQKDLLEVLKNNVRGTSKLQKCNLMDFRLDRGYKINGRTLRHVLSMINAADELVKLTEEKK